MNEVLVSIVMPAYNVESYIAAAIDSVLNQSWKNWELIIIENASTDKTLDVIRRYSDSRIIVLVSKTKGISSARNVGLEKASGEFVCFLDADDELPPDSIQARASILERNLEISFVDGIVRTFDKDMKKLLREWHPNFIGNPYLEMSLLNPRCFSAVTWLIRKESIGNLRFDITWSHLEDRIFFHQLSKSGNYLSIPVCIYNIRRRPKSLMTQNQPFEKSYKRFIEYIADLRLLSQEETVNEKKYFHKVFFRTYVKNLHLFRAIKHWIALNWLRISS
jgi:glycosyltransferase involved in cell wall biosynthesis